MKNLTLGKYVPMNTLIHKLDPRTKIIGLIALLVCVFLPVGFVGYGIIAVVIFTLMKLAKMKISSIFKSLKAMWFMMLFLFIFNLFLIHTGEVWFYIFEHPFYYDAFTQTAYIVIRLALMVSITSILTATTKPLDLTYGLEYLFTPLKVIKFPAHEIAMTISIALRFIPTLLEDTERIMKAQASRGVDMEEGKLLEKITAIVSLIIPLFISSFQHSDELANAMEARGYNPTGKRTRYRTLKMKSCDYVSLVFLALLLAGAIFVSKDPTVLHLWL